MSRLSTLLLRYHLPLGFALAFVVGLSAPQPGAALNDLDGSRACIAAIFLLSGLRLKTSDLKDAVRTPKAAVAGVISSLGLTATSAFALVRLPFASPEFARGLALFVCGPSTLSSGVVLTAEAQGSVASALLLTVATNALAVVVSPFLVTLVFDSAGSTGSDRPSSEPLDPVPLILSLLYFVLLPLLVGKLLRSSEAVRTIVERHVLPIKISSSVFMILVPWMKVSASVEAFASVHALTVLALAGSALGAHAAFLVLNAGLCLAARMPTEQSKAVVLVASQKTLGVAIAIVEALPASAGDKGLLLLPCLIAHLLQIFVDAWVAVKWAAATKSSVAPLAAARGDGAEKGAAEGCVPDSGRAAPNDAPCGDARPAVDITG